MAANRAILASHPNDYELFKFHVSKASSSFTAPLEPDRLSEVADQPRRLVAAVKPPNTATGAVGKCPRDILSRPSRILCHTLPGRQGVREFPDARDVRAVPADRDHRTIQSLGDRLVLKQR